MQSVIRFSYLRSVSIYNQILKAQKRKEKLLAILIDPDKFELTNAFAKAYLKKIPKATTHLFIGGSTDPDQKTETVVRLLKTETELPLILFPGNYNQITKEADALLFLSLLSGDNPEFLVGQQIKAARMVQKSNLEIIPTAYLLIDGDSQTSVELVSGTKPLSQEDPEKIIKTTLAGQYLGKKLVYLEAGSGAKKAVNPSIIKAVSEAISIPVIVGGGIRSQQQLSDAYIAGATFVVIGTALEQGTWSE